MPFTHLPHQHHRRHRRHRRHRNITSLHIFTPTSTCTGAELHVYGDMSIDVSPGCTHPLRDNDTFDIGRM
jgi:hypothetical protein